MSLTYFDDAHIFYVCKCVFFLQNFTLICLWYHIWHYVMVAFIVKNPIDLDFSDEIDPVWWKRKKNAFIRFITVKHTVISFCPIIPQSLFMTLNCLLERLRHMHHGRGFKNLSAVKIFFQMRPRRSRVDYEPDLSDRLDFWLWTQPVFLTDILFLCL